MSLRHWVIAIYLEVTSLKGVSSMKLHRDLGVTQRTAWFRLHQIREGLIPEYGIALEGPVEADETYVVIDRPPPFAGVLARKCSRFLSSFTVRFV